jgi:predicted transcriptional regulator
MGYRDFIIEIRSKSDFIAEVRSDLRQISAGTKQEEPVERVFFESIDAANRLLTPKRLELLRLLHDEGGLNTNELAKLLSRDYKNVRQDVLALAEIGLIIKEGRRLTAPWRKVTMEFNLAAA